MSAPIPKRVLVTGAAGALGAVVARKFRAGGAEVIATDHPSRCVGHSDLLPMDLSDPGSVRSALAAEHARDGGIEALAHCAGGFRYGLVDQVSDEDFKFLLEANFRAGFHLLREVLPPMKKRGFGRIVVVSARGSLSPSAGFGPYAATKAALNALVSAAADEVKSLDICVNAVLPTVIDTPANRRDMPKADFATWVTPDALADIIFSLTQPWGSPINGALIPVAGRL